jgi:hypothetical protein
MTKSPNEDLCFSLVHEPTLNDLLSEPIIQALMARDGVVKGDVVALMRRIGKRRSEERLLDAV